MKYKLLKGCFALLLFLSAQNLWADSSERSEGMQIAESLQEENVPANVAAYVANVIDQNIKDSSESRIKKGLSILRKYGLAIDEASLAKFKKIMKEILDIKKGQN